MSEPTDLGYMASTAIAPSACGGDDMTIPFTGPFTDRNLTIARETLARSDADSQLIPKTLAVLEKMYELLQPEDSWCKHTFYKTPSGDDSGVWQEGYSMCLLGARNVAAGQHIIIGGLLAEAALTIALGGQGIAEFNDLPETTREDVLLLVKRTIGEVETMLLDAPE